MKNAHSAVIFAFIFFFDSWKTMEATKYLFITCIVLMVIQYVTCKQGNCYVREYRLLPGGYNIYIQNGVQPVFKAVKLKNISKCGQMCADEKICNVWRFDGETCQIFHASKDNVTAETSANTATKTYYETREGKLALLILFKYESFWMINNIQAIYVLIQISFFLSSLLIKIYIIAIIPFIWIFLMTLSIFQHYHIYIDFIIVILIVLFINSTHSRINPINTSQDKITDITTKNSDKFAIIKLILTSTKIVIIIIVIVIIIVIIIIIVVFIESAFLLNGTTILGDARHRDDVYI